MHPPDPLNLCTTCPVPHFDNCDTCFGFGVYEGPHLDGIQVPVSAKEAFELKLRRHAIACPQCGSTVVGPPSETGGQ